MANLTTVYNPFTLQKMQQKYPYVRWVDYVNSLLPSPLSVDSNEVVIVLKPIYFNNLGKLLSETPPHVVANYIMWRAISYSTFFLSKDFRKRESEFRTVFGGQQEFKDKWTECVEVAKMYDQLKI